MVPSQRAARLNGAFLSDHAPHAQIGMRGDCTGRGLKQAFSTSTFTLLFPHPLDKLLFLPYNVSERSLI